MKQLKIQYFGPIKSGFSENNGFLTMDKVVVVCGPQASGKSCIVKLFSTFSWLEKALVRGDFSIDYLIKYNRFKNNFCKYQNIHNYFTKNTYIEYIGDAYHMTYSQQKLSVVKSESLERYQRPQVMYVPAERNLLSVVEHAENKRDLSPTLVTLLEVYLKACKRLEKGQLLPINNIRFRYDKLNKIAHIGDENYSVHLSEASSGIQSFTPMYIALQYLSDTIGQEEQSTQSFSERERVQRLIKEILKDNTIDDNLRKDLLVEINDAQYNKCLVSIIEEPEQNLHPTSQQAVLASLLKIVQNNDDNQLIMTTHSPFVINYLSLFIKAFDVQKKIVLQETPIANELQAQLNKYIPQESAIDGNHVRVYEIDINGKITELEKYDNMPSDSNVLNTMLADINIQFDNLLAIEDECPND